MWHSLSTSLELPVPVDEVFGFFADAGNLAKITPSELGLRILTPQPMEIAEGARIDYRLRSFGIPIKWRTLITAWEPPIRFVDIQLRGPYKDWIHTHEFESTDSGTRINDYVRYRLRLAPLGEIAHPFVRKRLERIFRFRDEALRTALLPDERA